MCIKPLLPQLSAQRHYTSLQYKFGESDRASYWASVHWKRKVPGRDLIQAMYVGDVVKGCPSRWVHTRQRMQKTLPVGEFVEGELYLSWM